MLNIDRVRGMVGSQFGSYTPNLGNYNFEMPLDFNQQMQQSLKQLQKGISFDTNQFIQGNIQPETKPDAIDVQIPETNLLSNVKQAGKEFVQSAGNFLKNNGNQLANIGLDMLGNSFNNVENSGGINTAFAVGDTIANGIGMVNPVFGLAAKGIMTAVKGINSIGGKRARKFSINQATASQVGASYGGSMADITNAAQNSGKKYGLFSGSKRRKANAAMNEAERQQNIMTNIADDARDMQAMAGNDLNYTNYQFDINGGYDQRYIRAAKSGMKLQDKIDFIKQKRAINSFINLDIKEIEWEPIIDDVEKFKEGGVFPYHVDNSSINYPVCELEWEPIIDDLADDWEPTIDDIELYREGGKTKEELETPEIEETNQNNLIPEGALHKNKHHMENTEGLTQKGIPVIDNDGEQQAEIELDEIIFTLEVTKKLEELYKDGSDEAAIEAGKLLVKEILFNTDDRTGLISKCEKGGKL